MHANSYSSKFPALTGERHQQLGTALAEQCAGRAAGHMKHEFLGSRIGNADAGGQRGGKCRMNVPLQCELTASARQEIAEFGFAAQYVLQLAHCRSGSKVRSITVGHSPGRAI